MSEPKGRGGIDSPDFLIPALPHKQRVQIGLAEHAIRVGSPMAFEVTGNLLHHESWEHGFGHWQNIGTNSNCIAALDPTYSYKGGYSVKMQVDNVIGHYNRLLARFPYPYETTLGFEWAMLWKTAFTELQVTVFMYGPTKTYQGLLKFRGDEEKLYYYATVGGFTFLENVKLSAEDTNGWRLCKLVLNMPSVKYSRFVFDYLDIDMADKRILNWGAGDFFRLEAIFRLEALTNTAESVYIDNIIITLNEPI